MSKKEQIIEKLKENGCRITKQRKMLIDIILENECSSCKEIFYKASQADEKIGFVFPIYSWAPPEIVLNFIRQLSLKGYKRQYLFFVCSCGDDTGLTQQVLEKALSHKGWKCHAGFSVTMPNNYVLLPGFDVDKKELEEKKLADAIPTLNQINASISRREELFLCHEGSIPFIKTRIINPLFNRFQMSPGNFYTTDIT